MKPDVAMTIINVPCPNCGELSPEPIERIVHNDVIPCSLCAGLIDLSADDCKSIVGNAKAYGSRKLAKRRAQIRTMTGYGMWLAHISGDTSPHGYAPLGTPPPPKPHLGDQAGGQDPEAQPVPGIDCSTAPIAPGSQYFLDNLVARLAKF